MDVIASFENEYEFLSNFYECAVTFEGLIYGSSEAAFQAQKTSEHTDRRIFTMLKPGEAKRAGYKAKLRPDWEEVKVSVMNEILRAKFTQNPDLSDKLLATKQALLVEGNDWEDTFWGFDVNLGYGRNMLGQLLMKIRAELQGRA